jgi:hypothetical protein
VVDHLSDFLDGQAIAQRDREVELQFLGGPQRDQRAQRYQAARTAIQPGARP